jgi:hypothetical protein
LLLQQSSFYKKNRQEMGALADVYIKQEAERKGKIGK